MRARWPHRSGLSWNKAYYDGTLYASRGYLGPHLKSARTNVASLDGTSFASDYRALLTLDDTITPPGRALVSHSYAWPHADGNARSISQVSFTQTKRSSPAVWVQRGPGTGMMPFSEECRSNSPRHLSTMPRGIATIS